MTRRCTAKPSTLITDLKRTLGYLNAENVVTQDGRRGVRWRTGVGSAIDVEARRCTRTRLAAS